MHKNYLMLLAVGLLSSAPLSGSAQELGAITTLETSDEGHATIRVALTIPPKHYAYAESTSVTGVNGTQLTPVTVPDAKSKFDPFFEKDVDVYDHSVDFVYRVASASNTVAHVEVRYQACNADTCFFPQRDTYSFELAAQPDAVPENTPKGDATADTADPETGGSWETLLSGFETRGTAAGYLPGDEFIAFLERAESGEQYESSSLARVLESRGVIVMLLLTLLLGLGLNLTPCVLPMIPINIAIIGAGAQSGSRARGFALGGTYGLGIAFVYGLLGVIVVYTRSKFGQLNASPWFNISIAVIFIVLALAMFDKLSIDFSRFSGGKGGQKSPRGGFIAAAVMGSISALLAGACVAPALISVLVLASDLYAKGNNAGLLLPFVLGLGMALPWPFAGAGLSFLPKPGGWMERVKQIFGVIMMLFAAYYLWTGVKLMRPAPEAANYGTKDGWHTSLDKALQEAADENKPVFVDFWASWCKSCLQMDKSTFKDESVKAALSGYVKVKVQAENPSASGTKEMLDYFGAVGLPTYAVLTPKSAEN